MIANLRNREILPSFLRLPDENDLDDDFYDDRQHQPRRHWCLLAEIIESECLFRFKLTVRDIDGHTFPVAFYLDDADAVRGRPSDLSPFKKGNTLAAMYADQHSFLDMTTGLRLEDSKSFRIIPLSMTSILRMNDQLHAKLAGGKTEPKCHTCGQELESPKRCSACGLATYCAKECQTKAWQETHKGDCKQLRHLNGLFNLDWYNFDAFKSVPT